MSTFGQNRGYIEELYASYLEDPASVSAAWRDYFADYRPDAAAPAATQPATPVAEPAAETDATLLRGAAARIAENMNRSLGMPTATSARTIAVKMLDENRLRINQHQTTVAGSKISFTHLIAWAVVRALRAHPAMNAAYAELFTDSPPARAAVQVARIPRDAKVEIMLTAVKTD